MKVIIYKYYIEHCHECPHAKRTWVTWQMRCELLKRDFHAPTACDIPEECPLEDAE